MLKRFKVTRDLKLGLYPLHEIFKGLEKSRAIADIFGGLAEARALLSKVKVQLNPGPGYMRVSDEDGRLVVSRDYLLEGDTREIYLDLIHELTHVKQFREGLDIYDSQYSYVERPTEIEAYRRAVEEAQRIGMSNEEILDYLHVEWISRIEAERLAEKLGIQLSTSPKDKKGAGKTSTGGSFQ